MVRASAQMLAEEIAGHVEDAGPIRQASFRAAAGVLPHVHAERARQLVEIRTVEKRVRQAIDSIPTMLDV